MKIINKTNFQTEHFNIIIREVAKREMVDLKDAVFTIIYRRGGRLGIAGYAYYGTPARVTLKIPKDGLVDKVELAYVIAHELCHTQNLRHTQMKSAAYSRKYAYKHGLDWRQYYLWANDLTIEKKVEVKNNPSKEQVVIAKRDKCAKAMYKWEKRVQNSQKHYLKWRRKYMYYENQLEKAAVPNDLS